MRCYHVRVGEHNERHIVPGVYICQCHTFFIVKEVDYFCRRLNNDLAGVFFHHLFFDMTQNLQCERFHTTDSAVTGTGGEGFVA